MPKKRKKLINTDPLRDTEYDYIKKLKRSDVYEELSKGIVKRRKRKKTDYK